MRPPPRSSRPSQGRGGREQIDDGEAVADGDPVLDLEDHPHLPGGTTRPGLSGSVEVPGAVHPEVRVQAERDVAAEPHEQVLAPRDHLEDLAPGQVGRGERRDPEVAAHQHPPGERLVEVLPRQPDRVALGHSALAETAEEAHLRNV